jgi:hypothetical protein
MINVNSLQFYNPNLQAPPAHLFGRSFHQPRVCQSALVDNYCSRLIFPGDVQKEETEEKADALISCEAKSSTI